MCTHSKLHLIYIVLHVHLLEGAYIPWMQFVLTVEHAIRHINIYAAFMGHHHLEHMRTHTTMAHTMHNSSEAQHACMHSTPPSTHPAPRRDKRSSAAVQPYPRPSAQPSAHSAPRPECGSTASDSSAQALQPTAHRAQKCGSTASAFSPSPQPTLQPIPHRAQKCGSTASDFSPCPQPTLQPTTHRL